MHADKHKHECNPQLLGCYLDRQSTAEEEAELEAHLEACPACRQQISDSAAEGDWWTGASRYLRADAWDEGAGHSVTASLGRNVHCRDQWSRDEDRRAREIVIRQLKEWFDPTDDPQYVGRFGGYEILGVIGQGGMGVVLKGFEPALNRYVAIKVLSPTLATSGAARKRFAREAQAAAAVLHENVIAIHRVADAHDLPYLVMPYVGGMSLQKRIDDEGPLPLVAILRISRQIAAGLAAAHAQGLVHRDIKPANILLERGVERVTITDFGLARAADDGSVTKTGFIAGTPQYMSPEQARGEPLDARSDLFSLGSVIYAMCTGHPPFRAETTYGILRRITDGQPGPIRAANADIPAWLESIVAKLHAKSPGERIASAEALAELLEQCLAHVQQPTVSPLPAELRPHLPGRRWAWPVGIGSAIVVCVALASFAFLPPKVVPTGPVGPDPQMSAAAPVEPGGRNLQDLSPHETEWDAAAGEIDALQADASQLSAEVERLWPLPPKTPTKNQPPEPTP
ncbi:MAG: serine/threonine-protein kinase [Pirellulaceae bacterium]